jgi:hypothetical protein
VKIRDANSEQWALARRAGEHKDLPKVKIVSESGHGATTKVFIDGEEVNNLRAIGFGVTADEVVLVRLEMYVQSVEFEGSANIVPIYDPGPIHHNSLDDPSRAG